MEEELAIIFTVILGLVIWGAFIPTIQELTTVPAENTSGLTKLAYNLMYGTYVSMPLDIIAAYLYFKSR
jgi:hypothetical protein